MKHSLRQLFKTETRSMEIHWQDSLSRQPLDVNWRDSMLRKTLAQDCRLDRFNYSIIQLIQEIQRWERPWRKIVDWTNSIIQLIQENQCWERPWCKIVDWTNSIIQLIREEPSSPIEAWTSHKRNSLFGFLFLISFWFKEYFRIKTKITFGLWI